MKKNALIASLAVIFSAISPALAVVTNVAPSGVIIQSSGSLNGNYTPAHVIDANTNENPYGYFSYWLGPAGKTTGYFILDLMGEYPVNEIALFNTHGGLTQDSGTASFAVSASDTIGPSFASVDRFYPFDGNLNDYSGNGVNAVEVDTSLSPTTAVFSNGAPAAVKGFTESLALSGYGESIEIPDPSGFNQPTAYSYSMWVECETNYFGFLSPASLILRTAFAGNENNTWSHQLRLNANLNFEAYLWDGAQKTVTGTTVVQPNVWYHVAVTAENGGLEQLYVNGVEEGTPVAVGAMWTGGTITEIGTGSGGGFQASSELFSDVGIWYSVLTPASILSLGQGTSPTNLTAASGVTLVNPKIVVSGTLSNVTGQVNITPNVYKLSSPVTARYWRFDALSCDYPPSATNSVGLNEFELFADVAVPSPGVAPAVELNWPVSPFPLLTSSNLLSTNWLPVEPAPFYNGAAFVFTNVPAVSGTNFSFFAAATNAAGYYALPGPAKGQTVGTNVARSGSIIFVSSSYTGPDFPAYCVIDGNTAEATNVCAIQPPDYWLATDADTNASFVLDLQREYAITSVALYNTHNGSCNDRDTGLFTLDAIDGITTTTNFDETNAVARYYPFDGTTNDASGNGVNAVLLDGPNGNLVTPTYSSVIPTVLSPGQSLLLSGNGDRLEIDDPAGMAQPTAYTLSAWVNFSDLSKPMSLIVRTQGSGSESNTWSHQLRVLPTGQFETYLWIGSPLTVIGTTMAQTGVWYHVVATAQNGDYMHLYVNGKEEGTPASVSAAMWNAGDRWTMGTGSGDGTGVVPGFAPLLGDVDSLAVWFSAISATEVQQLYTGTKPTAIKGGLVTLATSFDNPRPVASGTLSDTAGQVQIVPDVFQVSPPVTARYLRFQALSSNYPAGYVGLNEIEVYSTIPAANESISRALLLSWPHNPFNLVLQSSPDNITWTTVSAQPTLVGTTWQVYVPGGLYYRLATP